jgi:hypothetical protein
MSTQVGTIVKFAQAGWAFEYSYSPRTAKRELQEVAYAAEWTFPCGQQQVEVEGQTYNIETTRTQSNPDTYEIVVTRSNNHK